MGEPVPSTPGHSGRVTHVTGQRWELQCSAVRLNDRGRMRRGCEQAPVVSIFTESGAGHQLVGPEVVGLSFGRTTLGHLIHPGQRLEVRFVQMAGADSS